MGIRERKWGEVAAPWLHHSTKQGRKRVIHNTDKFDMMPMGIVLRRAPGVTQWAKYAWKAIAVLPGAAPADWQLLREEAGVSEFHAATLPLELHGSDAEASRHGLSTKVPCVYVVLRERAGAAHPLEVTPVNASA